MSNITLEARAFPISGPAVFARLLLWLASGVLVATALLLTLNALEVVDIGLSNWRPLLYAYGVWAVAICVHQWFTRGERGQKALFVLPAALFTVAVVLFPTFFGFYIAFHDWNLSSPTGAKFNGIDNLRTLVSDAYFWNSLGNMAFYVLSVLPQYALAFTLALFLNTDIKARKFFRVAFLLPFMLSPVAVSWMIGKSLMEVRFGPLAALLKQVGWSNPAFFADPWTARLSIVAMDSWMWVPFMTILLLAGLQAMNKEIVEAAEVDGASPWRAFWEITFPLMLPVSITTIMLRIIFQLKLADIVINVTSGGPGGATDTISSFVFREYRDRSNVGYGTMVAMVYLVLILIFMTLLLKAVNRWMQKDEERD